MSPVEGVVTKLGFPYSDELFWRYVEITDPDTHYRHRLFYVIPDNVRIGIVVYEGDPIGTAQDITKRYPDQGMLPHIHYEVKDQSGDYIDPEMVG